MNKHRNQPSERRLTLQPSCSSARWTSGKALITVLVSSALAALCLGIVIPVFHLMKPSNARSKYLGDLKVVSEPTPTPLSATAPSPAPRNVNPADSGTVQTVVAENSTQSVHLASAPSPTPTPAPSAIVSDTPSNPARVSEADRKTAERERRVAERRRSRLETRYQNHLISGEAYKKGQYEYQSEMAKYHRELSAGTSTN